MNVMERSLICAFCYQGEVLAGKWLDFRRQLGVDGEIYRKCDDKYELQH